MKTHTHFLFAAVISMAVSSSASNSSMRLFVKFTNPLNFSSSISFKGFHTFYTVG